MTKQITINCFSEITIPWKKGPARTKALDFVEKVQMSGLPYTYSVEVSTQSAADVELDL